MKKIILILIITLVAINCHYKPSNNVCISEREEITEGTGFLNRGNIILVKYLTMSNSMTAEISYDVYSYNEWRNTWEFYRNYNQEQARIHDKMIRFYEEKKLK